MGAYIVRRLLLMIPTMFGIMAVPMLAMGGVSESPGLALIMGILVFVVMIVVTVLMTVLQAAYNLSAGLTGSFGAGFDLSFWKDFASKMWVETILSSLFLVVTA